MRSSELARIERLSGMFSGGRGVVVGIGDDCAVLEGGLVWTIDEQVEGTHFRRELLSFEDVGWRSFMAAASDLAAMGAAPWCALSALALPRDLDDEAFEALAAGQRDAATVVGAAIVGGNLARSERVSIATTLLGKTDRPVLRSGARPGDTLWLAGHVGRAAAGLRLLSSPDRDAPEHAPLVTAWRRPVALIAAGLRMGPLARAAIDISDGLARDVAHLARRSGVRAVLDAAALETDDLLARAAAMLRVPALDLVLGGGEDYALVVAADADATIDGFRRIGEVTDGEGVALRTAAGIAPIEASGFDHFG